MDMDLTADLNAHDDDGLGWSTLADAQDPERVRPGAMLLAGNRYGQAVVRIVAVDDDGQVHFVTPSGVGREEPPPPREDRVVRPLSTRLSTRHRPLDAYGHPREQLAEKQNRLLTWGNVQLPQTSADPRSSGSARS